MFNNKYFIIVLPEKKHFPNEKNKTWITTGIKISGAHKRELYVLSRNTNNPELIRYYKKYCKILSNVIKLAKKYHYNKLPSQRVITSTCWKGVVLPMIPKAMPAGA
jgi:hypothetical protein